MVRDIIPWRKKKSDRSLTRQTRDDDHPLATLHREMNQLFDDFFGDLGFGLTVPHNSGLRSRSDAWSINVDVAEDDKEVRVTADVPGMDEKDIDVELSHSTLTIRGEKRNERDERKADYHLVERSYGSFQRVIPLPDGLAEDEAKARFKNGVLTIVLPKTAEYRGQRKQIPIAAE